MSAACRATRRCPTCWCAQEDGKIDEPKFRRGNGQSGAPRRGRSRGGRHRIGNDGEQRRVGFQTYVPQRMSGFAGESKRRRGREFEEFPELSSYDAALSHAAETAERARGASRDQIPRRKPIKARSRGSSASPTNSTLPRTLHDGALARHHFARPCSTPITSPRRLSWRWRARWRNEYRAIHKAGLILQIDAPDLAMDRSMMYRDLSDARVSSSGASTISRPSTRASKAFRRPRAPPCLLRQLGRAAYPRRASERILPVLYQSKAGALSVEFSNPRHQHEYEALKRHSCRRTWR